MIPYRWVASTKGATGSDPAGNGWPPLFTSSRRTDSPKSGGDLATAVDVTMRRAGQKG